MRKHHEKIKQSTNQTLMTTFIIENDRDSHKFNMDLARTFLRANISLYKIAHRSVEQFIQKYTKYATSSETK